MKKIMILFYFWFIAISYLHSQQTEITGKIINTKDEPVEYANIQLLNTDSVFLKGTASGRDGKFKLEVPPQNDYLIIISTLGYQPMKIALKEIRGKTALGTIVLDESSVALDEVTIAANRIIQKIDRQITYPSRIAMESSNNALELLKNMSLPRVLVNVPHKEITLAGNENIKLRINGIDAVPNQIAALQAKEIIRIDYYDNPGVRVQESAIIDFIVKKRDSGGYLSTDLTNAPYMGFGEDMVSSKFNHKNSEWTIFYNLSFRSYKKRDVQNTTEFFFPEETITQQTVGIPSPFNYQVHSLNLSYNYTITDKRVFNVFLSGVLYNNDGNNRSINYYSNEPEKQFPSQMNLNYKEKNPVLDIYYKEEISKSQTLYLNLVTGYINTNYQRYYQEDNNSDEQETFIQNYITGNKYSVIGEASHQIRWNKFLLYSGINYKLGYTRNYYEGDNDEKTSLNNSDLYFYSQLQGKTGKFAFSAGIGVKYSYFSDQDKRFRYWTIRPTASLSYTLTKNISIRYMFDIRQSNPSLGELSDVMQIEDRFKASMGNSGLKPYRIYNNFIQFNYQGKKLQCYIGAFHRYYSKVIMDDTFYDETISRFVQVPNNQKHLQMSSPFGGLNWEIITDRLSFSLNGQIAWIDSKGNDYYHKYTTYDIKGQLNFNLKNWRASIGAHSRSNYLWGETINYGDWWSTAEVGYKHKELYLGVEANNFLTDKWSSGSKNLSRLTPGTSWTYIDDSAPIFCLKLSWNFSWGKQSKAEQKALQNEDTDSGVRKIE